MLLSHQIDGGGTTSGSGQEVKWSLTQQRRPSKGKLKDLLRAKALGNSNNG